MDSARRIYRQEASGQCCGRDRSTVVLVCMLVFLALVGGDLLAAPQKRAANARKNRDFASALPRDVTYITSLALTEDKKTYDQIIFTHDGARVFTVQADGSVRMAMTKTAQTTAKIHLAEAADATKLYISPDDKYLAIVCENAKTTAVSSTIWICDISRLDSIVAQYKFAVASCEDVVFPREQDFYFVLDANNRIDQRDLYSGTVRRTFSFPQYDEKNVYYTRIRRLVHSPIYPNTLFLVDVGPAEELSSVKKGLHLNFLTFDFVRQALQEPVSLFLSEHQTVTPEDFQTIALSPDGKYVFMGLNKRMLYYNLVNGTKKQLPIIDRTDYLYFSHDGRFLLSSGAGTTLLWSVVGESVGCRLLMRFLTHASHLCISNDSRYMIADAKNRTHLQIFNIKEAVALRTNPSEYVLYCARKHTKIELVGLFNARRRKEKRQRALNYTILTNDKHNDQLIKKYFERNLFHYANRVFNIAMDYCYTEKDPPPDPTYMNVYTDGFEPIRIPATAGNYRHRQTCFQKGWYHWENVRFGLTKTTLFIRKAVLVLDGYRYKYDDSQNESPVKNVIFPKFSDFDLRERVE